MASNVVQTKPIIYICVVLVAEEGALGVVLPTHARQAFAYPPKVEVSMSNADVAPNDMTFDGFHTVSNTPQCETLIHRLVEVRANMSVSGLPAHANLLTVHMQLFEYNVVRIHEIYVQNATSSLASDNFNCTLSDRLDMQCTFSGPSIAVGTYELAVPVSLSPCCSQDIKGYAWQGKAVPYGLADLWASYNGYNSDGQQQSVGATLWIETASIGGSGECTARPPIG
jgi:hypothetical protein